MDENSIIIKAVQVSEGASVYITAGADGITENDAMDEEKLTDGNQL